jgi:hypothetical protein
MNIEAISGDDEVTFKTAVEQTSLLLAKSFPGLGFVVCAAVPPSEPGGEAQMLTVAVSRLDPATLGRLLAGVASECLDHTREVADRRQ